MTTAVVAVKLRQWFSSIPLPRSKAERIEDAIQKARWIAPMGILKVEESYSLRYIPILARLEVKVEKESIIVDLYPQHFPQYPEHGVPKLKAPKPGHINLVEFGFTTKPLHPSIADDPSAYLRPLYIN